MNQQYNWNERFSGEEYVYGTEPNTFLVEHVGLLRSPVLSIAEGEGRNAVYLASQGLAVHGVDGSEVGLAKAQSLAQARNVSIQTEVADLSHFMPRSCHYGSVVSIFAHLPSSLRTRLYPLIAECLQPDGIVLLEAYSERQIDRDTGGPKDLDLLMSVEKIEREFPQFEPILLQEVEREVCEGQFHTGAAFVVQFIGRKKSDRSSTATHADAIRAYERGASLLIDTVGDMTPEEILFRSNVGLWNTHEIVCHLVDFEIINAERIGRVLAEDQPMIMNADPDPMAKSLAYSRRDFQQQLSLLQSLRQHVASILRSLRPEQWERTGRHSTDGLLTVNQLVQRVTAHIPHHVKFIEEKKRAVRQWLGERS